MSDIPQYDIAVAYRVYPGISKTPAIFPTDKYELTNAAFSSLARACGNLRVIYHILLDNCPSQYRAIFLQYIEPEHLIFYEYPGVGNGATFGEQCAILLQQHDAEILLFCEDDYFFFDNAIVTMLSSLSELPDAHFLTPYDHSDYYFRKLQRYPSDISIAGTIHWRRVATTCMTFLTTKTILEKTNTIFQTYTRNNYDASLWAALTKKIVRNPRFFFLEHNKKEALKIYLKAWYYCWRQIIFGKKYTLWSPVPTLATHLEKSCLSPGIDWKYIFTTYGIEHTL